MDTKLVSKILGRCSEAMHGHFVKSIEQVSKHSVKIDFFLDCTYKSIL
jgi:hypothetical protein